MVCNTSQWKLLTKQQGEGFSESRDFLVTGSISCRTFQEDTALLEKSRDAVTQELASLTLQIENLEKDKGELEKLHVKHEVSNKKTLQYYSAYKPLP